MFGLKLFGGATESVDAGTIGAEEIARRVGARARRIEARPVPHAVPGPVAAAAAEPLDLLPKAAVAEPFEAGKAGAAAALPDGDDAPAHRVTIRKGNAGAEAAASADTAAATTPPPAGQWQRLIDYDRQDLDDFLRQAGEALPYPLAATHLLPPQLWEGPLGAELVEQFDLSPYRPWNSVFLPGDAGGALETGLPAAPRALPGAAGDEMRGVVAGLIALSRGESDPDAERAEELVDALDALRAENPALFQPEAAGMDPLAIEVRARIRAYALYRSAHAGLPLADIETAHRTFLPEMEALAN